MFSLPNSDLIGRGEKLLKCFVAGPFGLFSRPSIISGKVEAAENRPVWCYRAQVLPELSIII
jgi:hypothetical protein